MLAPAKKWDRDFFLFCCSLWGNSKYKVSRDVPRKMWHFVQTCIAQQQQPVYVADFPKKQYEEGVRDLKPKEKLDKKIQTHHSGNSL